MAQQIRLVDDIDKETDAVDTVEFSFKTRRLPRRELVLDVSEEHLEEFEADLTKWSKHARKADKPPATVRRAQPAVAPGEGDRHEACTPPGASYSLRQQYSRMRKEARAWALTHGWEHLGDRGRVPAEAYEAWKEANGWTENLFEEWTNRDENPQGALMPAKSKRGRAGSSASRTRQLASV